jgi:hypothetical protein
MSSGCSWLLRSLSTRRSHCTRDRRVAPLWFPLICVVEVGVLLVYLMCCW